MLGFTRDPVMDTGEAGTVTRVGITDEKRG